MAIIKLARPWYFQGRLYEVSTSGVDIPELEALAKAEGKKVEEILPKGAVVLTGATPLPETHPTVTTLSQLAFEAPKNAMEAVSASKGPAVLVQDEAFGDPKDGEPRKEAGPANNVGSDDDESDVKVDDGNLAAKPAFAGAKPPVKK